MKKQALLGAALGLALSFGAASMANATVYVFTQDACTGTCGTGPFGTVTVTNDAVLANTLDFSVQLAAGESFHDTGDPQHHALVFNLVGNPTITIAGLNSQFTANGSQAAGSTSASGFGTFDYVIDLPKLPKGSVNPTTLWFQATGAAPLTLESNTVGGKQVYFASDIFGANGNTGNVGAILQTGGGVPEPASWALMLVGFGGLGAALRLRRRHALALA
ncbi:PEPxxWA-CTERM sorting domain-containing protein [Phenylobacterium sp.]|jgi:hypothetical protein|uniref:PEPxxWA-CTERM sorting domain-containing protein n=1 Tax=Phenylobacterium sp. TaxID=1871053 RepID=UPI002E30DE72|nr:PEPxxWA-CTERM sorting domain-containing protein [Phenylobacterium sp.]HEX4711933.1 PEPxxWA-CTERM sorting domain-containing protein [Phenylobacterium sp.]